jgi:hypothetical protein
MLWVFVALMTLRAAVPWLAAFAATTRSVFVSDVCSIYGVHAVREDDRSGTPHHGDAHDAPDHCQLTSVLNAGLPTLDRLPAGVLHAPPTASSVPLAFDPPVADRVLNWLTSRLHAPPRRV